MMKCIAIDDENLALDLLEDNISKVPYLQLMARCKNPVMALDIINKEKIDLIFLDIQMPGINGLQLAESISPAPMIIFLTAYEKFALQGFNLDAVDYLLKPVSFERFLKATNKAHKLFLGKENTPVSLEPAGSEFIFVNSDYCLVKILVADITYIEGLKDYVKIFTTTRPQPILTRLNLKGIQEKLNPSQFLRVQKSFIVALNKIDYIRNSRIHIGKSLIPISDMYRDNLSSIFKNS